MSKLADHPLFLSYLLFQSKMRVSKRIQRIHHLNQVSFESTKVQNQTYGTEINRAAYHDELYFFDTMLSIER